MSKKNNFGRAIYDIFGVGKDDSEDELGGEAESSDFFPVREETSDFVPPPAQAREAQPPRRESAPPPPPPPPVSDPAASDWSMPMLDDYRVERAIPVHSYEGTYLAAGTMFRGTLTARGDVEIAGDFEGEIIAKGKITLHSDITSKITALGLALVGSNLEGDVEITGDVSMNDQSSIVGNVRAENMVCSGKIKGDLDIQDNLVLDGTAEVDGSIKADTMSVARGAKITGSVERHNMRK